MSFALADGDWQIAMAGVSPGSRREAVTLLLPYAGEPLLAREIVLGDASLRLWSLRVDEIPRSVLDCPGQLSVLSPGEMERYARFRFERDRDGYVAKRLLVRGLLSLAVNVPARELLFEEGVYGKPRLAGSAGRVEFSLSGSRGLAVCLIGSDRRCGVDVECLDGLPGELPEELILSAEERAGLDGVPVLARRSRMLQYWTLKEAYLKARGLGLSVPPQEISFALGDARGGAPSLTGPKEAARQGWTFEQGVYFEQYLYAVAKEGGIADTAELSDQGGAR